MDRSEPKDTYIVRDYDTLKVIADPLRAQIIEILLHGPLNVNQVAERLGLAASKLYYHFNMLEKIGLLAVAETKQRANLVEKIYTVTARTIDVDPALFNFNTNAGQENLNAALLATLDTTRDDVQRSIQARFSALEGGEAPRPRHMMLSRMLSRVSDARATEFQKRLTALLEEFDAADSTEAAQTYALMIAFYPSFYYRGDAPDAARPPDST